jgi:DNA-binding MarR family transcriptional regulator
VEKTYRKPLKTEYPKKRTIWTVRNLRWIERVCDHICDTSLRPIGINSTQFGLLVTIRDMQPAAITLIAKRIDMDRVTFTRNLDGLAASGLAKTIPGSDRRERLVCITERGDASLVTALPIWIAAHMRLKSKAGRQSVVSHFA